MGAHALLVLAFGVYAFGATDHASVVMRYPCQSVAIRGKYISTYHLVGIDGRPRVACAGLHRGHLFRPRMGTDLRTRIII